MEFCKIEIIRKNYLQGFFIDISNDCESERVKFICVNSTFDYTIVYVLFSKCLK